MIVFDHHQGHISNYKEGLGARFCEDRLESDKQNPN